MKVDRVFFGFVAVELFLIGVLVGSLTVSGVNTTTPHGLIEYWVDRYQTIIAGVGALLGAWLVTKQVREGRRQHQANMRLALRREFEAVQSAIMYADRVAEQCSDTKADIASLLIGNVRRRFFSRIDQERLASIRDLAGEEVGEFTSALNHKVRAFLDWQEAGSPMNEDVFGTKPPDFDARVEDIRQFASYLRFSCLMRQRQLESYVTG